eukprot:TRINITY_DN4840_c0_g1_i3.p1 TRINITY_DN4840_c0_g1~~TRINITY_DN4840_c0_g1_i3.p1  ORF type:complete len:203 (-),score=21.72 TRINITY_DN4840_c0_g1_i3:498-1106(-)
MDDDPFVVVEDPSEWEVIYASHQALAIIQAIIHAASIRRGAAKLRSILDETQAKEATRAARERADDERRAQTLEQQEARPEEQAEGVVAIVGDALQDRSLVLRALGCLGTLVDERRGGVRSREVNDSRQTTPEIRKTFGSARVHGSACTAKFGRLMLKVRLRALPAGAMRIAWAFMQNEMERRAPRAAVQFGSAAACRHAGK